MGRMWEVCTDRLRKFINLPFLFHVAAGAIIRLLLIVYASYHDQIYEVQYTDVDYRVFTDAARHVVNGESPYKRHTYRYSPILAFLMTPNVVLHPDCGKILFSVFDVLIAIACKQLVEQQLHPHGDKTKVPSYCAQLWLYHPLSMAISTRGNADAVPCFLIIMSLYFLRLKFNLFSGSVVKYSLAGFFLGLAIHLRLYPLAFSLPIFLSLGSYDGITPNTGLLDGLLLLLPNKKQVVLTLSCIVTLVSLTYSMFHLYGYDFLFETYIYHLFRRDTRHNFSIMFYYSYLAMGGSHVDIVKVLVQVFEVSILIMLSLKFGKPHSLPFALFCQAVVMVAFNSVITSQYFIWFLSLMPLVAHCLQISSTEAFLVAFLWLLSQSAWLFYAYLLEFKNEEVFIYIWMNSVFFFGSHIFLLAQVIQTYKVGYGFGLVQYPRKVETRKNQ